MTALQKFLKQIVLKKVKGSVYLVPAICDFQIEDALEEERKQGQTLHISDARQRFNTEYTWEYNLLQQVRWGTEDVKDDVCFYVKNWLQKIAEEEGYTLTKNVI